MNNRSSLLRYAVGFLVGGLLAAAAAGFTFTIFYPLPSVPLSHDHRREALVLLIAAMFIFGGFIGSRALSADFLSDLYLPVGLTYFVIIGLTAMATGELSSTAIMAGFATVGVLASGLSALILLHFFPPPDGTIHET